MKKRQHIQGPTSRREFTATLALLAAAPLVAPAAGAADKAAPDPLVDAATSLTEAIKARHGKHLTEEQLQSVGQSVLRLLTNAERMKRVPLRNSDEPAAIFQADLP